MFISKYKTYIKLFTLFEYRNLLVLIYFDAFAICVCITMCTVYVIQCLNCLYNVDALHQ